MTDVGCKLKFKFELTETDFSEKMKTKITLTIDKHVLEKAEKYALENNLSLGQLIENFLSEMAEKHHLEQLSISPFVKSLSSKSFIPSNYDYKKDYREYLFNKYK